METTGSPRIDLDKLIVPEFSSIESETFKKDIVIPYFKDIYKDLASRSDKKGSGINKVTILDYCGLPGILAERFFSLLDANDDEYIDLREFVYILFKIYYSNFDNQVKLVFDMYDFDRDGYITKEDVRIILSYIPILKGEGAADPSKEGAFSIAGGGHEEFSDRIKVQEEISQLIENCFSGKDKLNLEDFQKIIENEASDMLVPVLQLLRDKLPCSENFYKLQNEFEAKSTEGSTKSGEKSPTEGKKTKTIASPRFLGSLSPLARGRDSPDAASNAFSFLGGLAKGEQAKGDAKGIDEKDIQVAKFKKNKKRQNAEVMVKETQDMDSPTMSTDVVRLGNKNPEPKSILGKDGPKTMFASPTAFLGGSGAEREEEKEDKEVVSFEGEMMRKAKENKLKKYWYKL